MCLFSCKHAYWHKKNLVAHVNLGYLCLPKSNSYFPILFFICLIDIRVQVQIFIIVTLHLSNNLFVSPSCIFFFFFWQLQMVVGMGSWYSIFTRYSIWDMHNTLTISTIKDAGASKFNLLRDSLLFWNNEWSRPFVFV